MPPNSWLEIVILPALAVFFGLVLYCLALRAERLEDRVRWKWVPVIILAIGAFAAFGPFWSYVGPGVDSEIYRGMIPGRKMLTAHVAAFAGPVLSIAGILFYELWWRRRPIRED